MGAIAQDWTAMASLTPPPASLAPLVKRVWLLLYAEGARWTEAEIRKKLGTKEIHVVLRQMARRGYIGRAQVENIDGESSVQYGVTRSCKVPRGVTVDEMWAVLQAWGKP